MSETRGFGARSTADEVLADQDLNDRTILVTGCSGGIGFETMRALSARGAHIIGLARSFDAARHACSNLSGPTTPLQCDLKDLKSVASVAATIRALGRPLHAVITNAGVMCPKTLEVRHGLEVQFLVNHVAHALLIDRLLDLVPDQTGRIVIVSSSASVEQAPKAGVMFDNLDGSRFYKPFTFYGQSKLATALYAKALSRRLASRGIMVNSLHPGAVGGTGLQRNLGFPLSWLMPAASLFMKSTAQGAATQVFLAASPVANGVSGEYWANCQVAKGSVHLADPGMVERLWNKTAQIIAPYR